MEPIEIRLAGHNDCGRAGKQGGSAERLDAQIYGKDIGPRSGVEEKIRIVRKELKISRPTSARDASLF